MTAEWTIEQWVEHGRKWVRAGWTWAPGQIAIASWPNGDETEYEICIVPWGGFKVLDNVVPDLRNPGTRGHALDQVREAWNRPSISTKHHPVLGWIVKDGADDFLKSVACDTEHEALLAAREAAP